MYYIQHYEYDTTMIDSVWPIIIKIEIIYGPESETLFCVYMYNIQ